MAWLTEISRRRSNGLRRADCPRHRLLRQGQKARLVEDVAHLRLDAHPPDRLEPFAMDARILILVFDLAAALLHRNRTAAFRTLSSQRDERIARAAEAARKIARRLGAGIE